MTTKCAFAVVALCGFVSAAFGAVDQTVDELIPKLAAAKTEDRYAPQMELQALAAQASRPGAESERAALAKLLAAKAADAAVPQPARVWIVRQLEHIGAGESVAALTALLNGQEPELKECARRALEKNSSPAASESLRAALQQAGDAPWKIGLIQSLGQRGDAQAVASIAQSLRAPETSLAAASALGKIANDEAVKALWAAFDAKVPAAADALFAAANQQTARGEERKAAAIYAKLYAACSSVQMRAATLNGLAKTDVAAAEKLIPELLQGSDPKLQAAAVAAAQQAYGPRASESLAALFPKLNASGKVQVLRALNASAEKQVAAAAADPDEAVRAAAFETLAQIGSAASVPLLLQAAAEGPASVQKAAATALARIPNAQAGSAIAAAADQGDAKLRVVAINALADRDDRTALPALLKYAGDSERAISTAGCGALGRMGTEAELDPLVRLALAGKTPGAEAALQSIATRAHDKSATAKTLIACLQGASAQQTALLFDTLAALGGADALDAVAAASTSSNDELKDTAIRALANWPEFAAAKPLLAVISVPNAKRVHNVLAVQGIARLVRSADKASADQRLEAALAALVAAQRDEEKKLMLSALASIPSGKAAEAIKPFLSDPKLQRDAGQASLNLAQALRRSDRTTARNLAQAVKDAKLSDELTQKADAFLSR